MIQEMYRPGDPVADILFNWLPLLGTLALGVLGLVMTARGYRHYLNSTYLKRAGQPGLARVTEKWVKEGRVDRSERHRTKPSKRYFLRFQLLDDPRAFSLKEVAPISLWNGVEVGDTVEVLYHPRRRLMRLAAWTNYSGTNAGAAQMAIGAIMLSAAIASIADGAYSALRSSEELIAGENWVRNKAEVLNMGRPADPYLRIFAPGSRMIRVVFGETHGGAFLGNERIIRVTPKQIEAYDIAHGAILVAWMDPENEFNAVLDLERVGAGER
ncbi:MAG: hypothetical protein ABJX32_19605 [Tateyamaria sp.]|uniref:hypothetical protein n=1 Tax=Tateyamaria sp. TaxID=1929288 RepID=UPI00329AD35D